MSWTLLLGGAAAAGLLLHDSDPDHHDVVEETYEQLKSESPANAKVFADHVDGAPNPRGEVEGLDHVPDVVVKSGAANSLLVEVETKDSLTNSASEAKQQLQDFSKSGYRRILVVPKEDSDKAKEFADNIEDDLSGEYYLSTPKKVTELL
jgi:hypothetical protein